MGFGHWTWTIVIAFEEESVGYSLSGNGDVVTMWLHDFKKFPGNFSQEKFIQEWNTVIEFGQHVHFLHFLGKILQNFPP